MAVYVKHGSLMAIKRLCSKNVKLGEQKRADTLESFTYIF